MDRNDDVNTYSQRLDGNSEMGVHVRDNTCYLICWRHLIWSSAVWTAFFHPCVRNMLLSNISAMFQTLSTTTYKINFDVNYKDMMILIFFYVIYPRTSCTQVFFKKNQIWWRCRLDIFDRTIELFYFGRSHRILSFHCTSIISTKNFI